MRREWECPECGLIVRSLYPPDECPGCGERGDAFDCYEFDDDDYDDDDELDASGLPKDMGDWDGKDESDDELDLDDGDDYD